MGLGRPALRSSNPVALSAVSKPYKKDYHYGSEFYLGIAFLLLVLMKPESPMENDQPQRDDQASAAPLQRAHRIRLPGFLIERDIGLGDVIKHVTSSFGFAPCAGCGRRAASLNNWIVFGPQDKQK